MPGVKNAWAGWYGFSRLLPNSFLEITRDCYGAEPARLDFARRPDDARQTINRWVSDQTGGKIPGLFSPGSIDELSRLVLANAVYFHGAWEDPFDARATREDRFTLITSKAIRVLMMKQEGRFRCAVLDDLQILELPYKGRRLSMVIFLPAAWDGLRALERRLSLQMLEKGISELRSRRILVLLPKFTFSSFFPLSSVLSGMGMKLAFLEGEADFSGMDGGRELFISNAVHQAFVDVNEEGTEAVAATMFFMSLMGARPEPLIFRADHPFLFLIRDNATGSILFMGRAMDPTS
jgi:serpin B